MQGQKKKLDLFLKNVKLPAVQDTYLYKEIVSIQYKQNGTTDVMQKGIEATSAQSQWGSGLVKVFRNEWNSALISVYFRCYPKF